MTREEAINRLLEGEPFSELYDPTWDEALKMAIEALEQEPCEDCISREQLVRELNSQMAVDAITEEVVVDMLKHLPSVTTKPKTDVLDNIRDEIVHLHDWAFSRDEILKIIDRYNSNMEVKE